jgi:glucose/arabinose dehydrogenase
MKITRILLFISFVALVGTASAQTYTTTSLCTGLQYSVAFDFAPDGRIFLTQKGDGNTPSTTGSAIIKVYTMGGTFLANFYDLSDSCDSYFEQGLLGIAIDPDFVSNHYVYTYYCHIIGSNKRLRIVRFTENNNLGTNPTVIFDIDITSYNIAGNHVGGNLHFRPSDPNHIYFTIGDLAYHQTSSGNYAQMLDKPFGKTLRIGKDPVPAGYDVHSSGGFGCNVPTDNPYYDDGNPLTGNCDIIWSYGHRNPFDFCFSPVSDTMYNSENGLNAWDEVNVVHRGANYGWNTCEGFYMNSSTTTPCNLAGSTLPMEDWSNPPALTGILYYSGTVMPEFDNHLLVADNDNGRIYDLTLGNSPAYDTMISRVTWQDFPSGVGLTTLKQGSDGCIYAMKGGYTTSGLIYRICPQGLGEEDFINPYFSFAQNQPNPFTTTTTLKYVMKQDAPARIVLYDMFGREVSLLSDGLQPQGTHEITIDAQKLQLAPGTYFCSMESNGAVQSVKMIVGE